MPKFYDNPNAECWNRIPENEWFEVFQPILLWMANTPYGRQLLCINQDFPTIISIKKHSIIGWTSEYTRRGEFYVGAKFANIIRYRWKEWCEYAKRYPFNVLKLSHLAPMLTGEYGDTSTTYPDPHPETTTVDGRITGQNAVWATAQGASSGTAQDDLGGPFTLTQSATTGGGDYSIIRGFWLFDTGADIGASDTIDDATFSLWITSVTNTENDGDDWINVVQSSPASNTALVDDDYDQCGDAIDNPTEGATRIDLGSISTGAYTDWTLNATGEGWVGKGAGSITKLGTREGHDAIDSAITGTNDNIIVGYFAEQTGTANDPKLVVNYTVVSSTFVPKIMIF